MTPDQEKQFMETWASRTIFLAMNQKVSSGPEELGEKALIRSMNMAKAIIQEATEKCAGWSGYTVQSIAKRVFDWVEENRH